MKIEIWKHEAEQIVHAGEFQFALARLELDRALLAAVNLLRLNTLQEIDRLLDARLQFGEGFFRIGKARIVDAAETCGTRLDGIARPLHLARERQHIGRETRVDEGSAVFVRLALFQDRGKIAERADKDGNGSPVHGNRHGNLVSFGWR